MHNSLLKIYHTILSYSHKKSAVYVLAIVAFTESSFFIFPPDLLLLPMALAQPKKAFWFAFIAGGFSVLGGICGYFLGYYFYEYIGNFLINYFHYYKQFAAIQEIYSKYNAFAVFIGGFTPIPYKIITIFSGFVKADINTFILMSIIARFGRFFLLACIIYFWGNKAKNIIENHIGKLTIIFAIVIVVVYFSCIFKI